jgi:hypothetical protein
MDARTKPKTISPACAPTALMGDKNTLWNGPRQGNTWWNRSCEHHTGVREPSDVQTESWIQNMRNPRRVNQTVKQLLGQEWDQTQNKRPYRRQSRKPNHVRTVDWTVSKQDLQIVNNTGYNCVCIKTSHCPSRARQIRKCKQVRAVRTCMHTQIK